MDKSESTSGAKITKSLMDSADPTKLIIIVVIAAVVLGAVSGYVLSTKSGRSAGLATAALGIPAANPQVDTKTFKDFAEGVLKAKAPTTGSDYSEGTHLLERQREVPVALTSSVVDLSKYEGKKVKVFGETQKALKEGWLMDVGKVEELK